MNSVDREPAQDMLHETGDAVMHRVPGPNRRQFVAGGLTAMAAGALPAPLAARTAPKTVIPYGAAVRDSALVDDYDYRMALIEYCDQLVPEGSLKWISLRPTPEEFNFFDADRMLAFAEKNGMQLRGHTLAWYAALPDWANAIRGRQAATRELTHHIDTVVGRYKGKIKSWDAVNEPIADDPSPKDYLRPGIWTDNLGGSYVEFCLRRARQVDPDVELVINEYDVELVGDSFRRKREALLRLVKDLRDRDAPLHAIGLQGHLKGDEQIDKEGLSSLVAELAAMNVKVLVTELDVIDKTMPGDDALRDEAVAKITRDFLGAIFDAARPEAILTWGISDRYTWIPGYFSRDDGRLNRPLPLDLNYKPKAMMKVIEEFAGVAR